MVRAVSLSVALVALVSSSPIAVGQQWASELFPIKKHDFGSVARAAHTEFRFPVKNVTSEPIHISRVRASCGCTTPVIESEWIAPGETGYIKAHYNTDTFLGQKGATLTVEIDRPQYAEVQLRVDGYIRRDIVFDPGQVDFGSVDAGREAERTVTLAYAGRSDWRVKGVQSELPYVTAQVEEVNRQAGRVDYRLHVRLSGDAPEGALHGTLVVQTDDARMTRVPLEFTAEIQPLVQVSPKSLALGNLKPGDRVQKRLVVKGPQPFRLIAIDCEGFDVQFEPSDEPRAVHLVDVQLTALRESAQPRQELIVRTDLPGEPVGSTLVAAQIRQ